MVSFHYCYINYVIYCVPYTVAFMRFSLAAYSQLESNTTLAVSLVLDAFGGTGTGPSSITQNIDGQITALVQVGDTATGK